MGATSTSYTLASVAAGDGGAVFRAVVSNVAGSATRNDATLSVATAPAGALDNAAAGRRVGYRRCLGGVIVAAHDDQAIRRIDATGNVTLLAGLPGVGGDRWHDHAVRRFEHGFQLR